MRAPGVQGAMMPQVAHFKTPDNARRFRIPFADFRLALAPFSSNTSVNTFFPVKNILYLKEIYFFQFF